MSMEQHNVSQRRLGGRGVAARSAVRLACAAACIGGAAWVVGCADDQVGHSKTVEKRTVDTPTEKTTTTEVHEKDTRYVPK